MTHSTQERRRGIFYTCAYVPEEVLIAAGFRPSRLLPAERGGDSLVHASTCGYVKSLLGAAEQARDSGAAAIVIANSCDAMRRLYDLWEAHVPTPPALFLDLPKQADEDSVAFFAFELRELARRLRDDLAGKAAGDEDLEAAIKSCNELRSSMGTVFRRQRDPQTAVTGSEVVDLCLRACRDGKREVAADIDELARRPPRPSGSGTGARILLAGGLLGGNQLATEIETAGAQVVAVDSCIAARDYHGLVEEGSGDPMRALARRYLQRPGCARMHGFEERFAYLKSVAEEAAADGIVFHTVKFCDTFLYDVPMLRARFKQLDLPFLWLESDYGSFDAAQAGTRIEAFLETSCPSGR